MKNGIFKTFIKGDHKVYGENDYVVGRISGISLMICGEPCAPNDFFDETKDYVIHHNCSLKRYKTFKKIVEEHYPGLCVFNYQE